MRSIDAPFRLAILIVYAAVVGVGLTFVPPVGRPYYFSDLLALSAVLHLAVLIGLTYSQRPVCHREKELALFMLEFVVAVMYCWQFRLLDKVGCALQLGNSPKWLIITFYMSHIGLVLTMLPFRYLSEKGNTHKDFVTSIKRYWPIRVIGLATPGFGIAAELYDQWEAYLPNTRRVIAGFLLALVIWYIYVLFRVQSKPAQPRS